MIIFFLSVGNYMSKTEKKSTVFTKGTILSLVYQFVCVFVSFRSSFFSSVSCWALGGCVRKPRQHSCIISAYHMTISANWVVKEKRKKKKRINICIFSLPEGARGAEMWAAGRED